MTFALIRAGWLLAAASACAIGPAAPPAPPMLSVAPPIAIVKLGGPPTDLPTVTRGRVALVTFWATWCEACERELSALDRLSAGASAHGDGLVVGVSVGEKPSTVEGFARAHAVRYVLLVDTDFRLSDALGLRQVPATLVLDRDARIVYRGNALDQGALAAFRAALATP